MNGYFLEVYNWVVNPGPWIGAGPIWQILGIVLGFLTVLQLLPESFAGGLIFSKEAMLITLILDALWVFLVFVAAFIPIGATIALIFVVAFVISAILARNQWH